MSPLHKYLSFYLVLFSSTASALREGSIRIGERHSHPNQHRRAVSTDLNHGENKFDDTETITFETHEGVTKSFKKIFSKEKSGTVSGPTIDGSTTLLSRNNGYVYWHGESEDGSELNYLKDSTGVVQGSLVDFVDNIIYQMHTDLEGFMMVTITPSSEFDPEEDPEDDDDESGERMLRKSAERKPDVSPHDFTIHNSDLSHDAQDDQSNTSSRSRTLYDDNGGNLDVMVVWTLKAECNNANQSEGCAVDQATYDSMMARANLAIEETNTAYLNSGVNTEVLLVHAYRHPTYATHDSGTALSDLRNGNVPGVHSNRDTYGADIVAMLGAQPSGCGRGYVGPGINIMYSVTKYSCATGNYSFGHEMGHNLGLNHDRGTSGACSSNLDRYDYGWRDPQATFRTIMAYNCESGQCDNNAGGGCTRIIRFSTPLKTWSNGKVLGDSGSDSVRHINDVRVAVAGYHPHKYSDTQMPSVVPTVAPSENKGPKPSSNPSLSPAPTMLSSDTPSATPSLAPSSEPTFSAGYCGNNLCEAYVMESWFSCPNDCPFPNEPTYSVGSTQWSQGSTSSSRTGEMFDLEAANNDLTVFGFDVYHHFSATNAKVKVYVTAEPGSSFVGKETDPSKWFQVMEQTRSWLSGRVDVISLDIPIRIAANSVQGIYITVEPISGYFWLVTPGTGVGNVIESTNHISIKEGSWIQNGFQAAYSPYRFLGKANYFLNWPCSTVADCRDSNDFTEDICVNGQCQYNIIPDVCGNGICENSNDEFCATCSLDCSANCDELSWSKTSYATSATANGMLFDVTVDKDITIYEIKVDITSCSVCRVELFTKEGTYVGSETSQGDWTPIFSGSVSFSNGEIVLPIGDPLPLKAGSMRAFHFHLIDTSALKFDYNYSQGDVIASNSDITLYAGQTTATKFGSPTFTTYGYKKFFGSIKYEDGLIDCYNNCSGDTPSPSASPTYIPSTMSSNAPSIFTSVVPSTIPSVLPSTVPSVVPSKAPIIGSSPMPSATPSIISSNVPSTVPSVVPSVVSSTVPSVVPSIVPSIVPSVNPTMTTSTTPTGNGYCRPEDVMGRTFFAPGAGNCFKIVVGVGGQIIGDSSDPQCNTQSGTGTSFSNYDGFTGTTLNWTPENGFSGTMNFLENTSLTKPKLAINNFQAGVFDVTLELPSCHMTDSPSLTPSLTPSNTFCSAGDVSGAIFFANLAGICFKIELIDNVGKLIGDQSDSTCTIMSGTGVPFSNFDGFIGNTAIWTPGVPGYSGVMNFIRDPTISVPTLRNNGLDGQVFDVTLLLPSCQQPI